MTAPAHPQRCDTGYWLTPPEIYKRLDDEFYFDFDPCPYPLPEGYNGIEKEWGRSSFVNPPFHRVNGTGPTAFMRKAIEENKKGKTVVLIAPTQSYVNLMLEAGAELRSMGRIRWLHGETKEPCKDPSPITAFILRGNGCASHSSVQSRDQVLDELRAKYIEYNDIPCPELAEKYDHLCDAEYCGICILDFVLEQLRTQGSRDP